MKITNQIRLLGVFFILLGLFLGVVWEPGRFELINIVLGIGLLLRLNIFRILTCIYLGIALLCIIVLPYGGRADYGIDMAVTALRMIIPFLVVIFLLWFINRPVIKEEFRKKK